MRSALERAYLANSARALFIGAALRRVVGALTDAGVPALLLKGAALVETVYPDPGQREMLDLDILVPPDSLEAATHALAPMGYRPAPSAADGEPESLQLEAAQHHAPALIGDEHLVAVELHRHIAIPGEGGGFDMDGFWQRARPSSRGGHLLPSPEDLLLHVCMHFTRNRLGGSHRNLHTGGALGQVCDMARIVDREPVDWLRLVAVARGYGVGTRVFLALFAAHELGVQVPEGPLAELQPPGFDALLGRRLVGLRVLSADDRLPVRSLRWMFAPGREVLSRGWNAEPTATLSLASAYMRRARAHVPGARSSLRRPWALIQDHRLNDQIRALEKQS